MRKFEEIVEELAKIELDSGCHISYPEDYEDILDFYLENVLIDSYENFVEDNVSEEELENYGMVEIINGVENYIRENYKKQ